jgi:hypothetical protein
MIPSFQIRWPAISLVFLAMIVLAGGCREECLYVPRSLVRLNFQSPADSLSVRGLGREDSLLYAGINNVTSINLPVDGTAGQTGFIVDFDRGTDTIWFSYETIPWFHSPECGFILNFNLLGTWHTMNVIDSIVIVTSEITTFDDTNLRIYN